MARTSARRASTGIRSAGLTLLELMITVLLATILIGGLFYMMSGQQKTYSNQVATLSAQENLWGAMEYIERQIRMAGYGFGSCGGKILTVGTGDGGVDTLIAFEVKNNYNLFTSASDGTDSFSVRYAAAAAAGGLSSVRMTKEMPINATVMYVNSATGLNDNDLLVVCLPGYPATLMQLTAAPAPNPPDEWKLATNPASSYNPPTWNNLFGPGAKYPVGTLVAKFGSTKDPMNFAIDTTKDPPKLVTWTLADKSDLQIVASGIEDMQLAWACEVNNPSAPDGFTEGGCTGGSGVDCNCTDHDCSAKQTDEWANNVATDTVPLCGDGPIERVRVTLIARTDSPMIADKNGFRPEAEDHYRGTVAADLAATAQLGTYARAVLTSIVTPRNIKRSLSTSP